MLYNYLYVFIVFVYDYIKHLIYYYTRARANLRMCV
nr:MAG TPA: hypothetical protein [Microviridae sp.]